MKLKIVALFPWQGGIKKTGCQMETEFAARMAANQIQASAKTIEYYIRMRDKYFVLDLDSRIQRQYADLEGALELMRSWIKELHESAQAEEGRQARTARERVQGEPLAGHEEHSA